MRASWALLLILGACGIDNPGVDPPEATLNFPIALATSPGESPAVLYVANSNFDLRYNAGSVQSFDLEAIARDVASCSAPPCVFTDLDQFLKDEVLIGSHAADMAISPSGDRLYLAVRSDTNLTFIDIVDAEGGLECGGQGDPPRCADRFRRGNESVASERGVSLPGDPVGLAAGSLELLGRDRGDGDYVLMAHRNGRVSLFLDEAAGPGDAPHLVHVVSGLPEGLANIRLDARGFGWTPSATRAEIGRVGVAIDAETGDLVRSFAYDLGTLQVLNVDTGGSGDTRDLEFDATPDSDLAYVLSRRPEAILVADRGLAGAGSLGVVDVIPVGFGPSRVDLARLDIAAEGADPDVRTLLFVSCFDSRDVWVIDPALGEVLTVIRGMSGPFELELDTARGLLYVADFRASVVRIVDMAPLVTCLREGSAGRESCEPPVVGVLGEPRPVGELL